MNKKDLVKMVMEEAQLKKKDATSFVNIVFNNIQEALKNGQDVKLHGFGNFEVRERAPRKGRNPQTGEQIDIGAKKNPAFKPSRPLKKAVNE